MMLIAWHANSQNVIQKRDSVVISKRVAQRILIDLADYDRLIENKVEINLEDCIEIQKEKDTLINFMEQQNKLFKETIALTEKQLKVREEQLSFNKNKTGKGLLFGVGGLAIGTILGILFTQ